MENQPPTAEVPTVQAPISPVEKNKRPSLIVLAGILVAVLVAVIVGAYFLFLKQPTPAEAYQQALVASLTSDAKDAYASLDLKSDNTSISGQISGDLSGSNVAGEMYMKTQMNSGGVIIDLEADTLGISKNDKIDSYVRYKKMSAKESEYSEAVQLYFAPAINQWVKMDEEDEDDEATTFTKDGPTAAISLIGVFLPMSDYTKDEEKIFIDALKKYNLYDVSEEFETATFKGVETRMIKVDVKKDALIEFENEVSGKIKNKDKFRKSDTAFLNHAFGAAGQITATVYLDSKKSVIVGVELPLDLSEKVEDEEGSFLPFDSVTVSVLVEHNRKLEVKAPEKFITQKELQALLVQ